MQVCGTVHIAWIGRRAMKSLEAKQGATRAKSELFAKSYSPTLRVLIVGAIFLVAVSALAACGSSNKPSALITPTANGATSSSVTPSSSPTATQAVLVCNADKSSDSIDAGKYFGNILAQARKDWRPDANISSVRYENRTAKNFNSLCTLRTDSNWKIIFYSVTSKTELVADLDIWNKAKTELPLIRYEVAKKLTNNSESYMSMTIADMKAQGGWTFYVYSRPETAAQEARGPANLFLNWKMSMSQVIQRLIDRTKGEKVTGTMGYNIYMGKATLKTKTPYVGIYWENGAKKTWFYVEPISLSTYDLKL